MHLYYYFVLFYEFINQSVFVWFLAVVPGLPLIGNLLQLREKKPHKTFTKMAHKYGPIYSIRAGASTIIVLNTAQLAKQVPPPFTLFM
jgi:hypothetical protein